MPYSNSTPPNPFRWLVPETEEERKAALSQAAAVATATQLTARDLPATPLPKLEVNPEELIALRKHLGMSRNVFAHYLRTNPRTLENWEQGRARPNAQAACLIRLVQQHPDIVSALADL